MKYCSNCGAELTEGAVFCQNCGASVGDESTVKTAPAANTPTVAAPAVKLRTNRGLLKYILLSMITLGIYGIVVMSHVSEDINTIASKHDNQHTMHFCLIAFVFSWLTLGIVPLVWISRLSGRIGEELRYRNLPYQFSAGTYWGWGFFGMLILVGPFIFCHKLLKAMNTLAEDYNAKG